MKRKLALMLVLIILFGIFVAVRFFLSENSMQSGKLKIVSSPSASIFIDNVAIGKTPFEDKYKVGEYILKLIPEGSATETASWQGKVKVYRNIMTYVNRELGSSDITSAGEVFSMAKMETAPKNGQYGEIMVDSDPHGAIVLLDNDEKGIAPLLLADVQQGEHEISVYLPGFFRRTQKIHVEGGYRLNALFKLAIDQSQVPAKADAGEKEASGSAATEKVMVIIKDTPTGWLRVREEPTLGASESARVKPGEKYAFLDEDENGWYKIQLDGKKTGWVSNAYAEKKTE